jgi:hypothetical protein
MAPFKRGGVWWYKFYFAGQEIRESSKSTSKIVAKAAEQQRRRELEAGFHNLKEERQQRIRCLSEVIAEYLEAIGCGSGLRPSRITHSATSHACSARRWSSTSTKARSSATRTAGFGRKRHRNRSTKRCASFSKCWEILERSSGRGFVRRNS